MNAEVYCQNHVVNCNIMHFHIVICVVVFHFLRNITRECRDRKAPVQPQLSSETALRHYANQLARPL